MLTMPMSILMLLMIMMTVVMIALMLQHHLDKCTSTYDDGVDLHTAFKKNAHRGFVHIICIPNHRRHHLRYYATVIVRRIGSSILLSKI